MSHITRRALAGLALALPALHGASAQPAIRTAKILIGFPPGGLTDSQARLLAQKLQGTYAQTVVVENRPGASGRLAREAAKAADPDGSTMVFTPTDHVAIFPHLYGNTLRYDPFVDLKPVSMISLFHLGLSTGPKTPAKNLAEFIAWGRDQESIPFGNPGAGTLPHFLGIQFGKATGLKLTAVAYRGDGPAVQDCLGGQIPLTSNSMPAITPFISGSALKPLVTTAPRRVPGGENLPTMAEAGFPQLAYSGGACLMLPGRTPAPIVAALDQAVGRIVNSADSLTSLVRFGVVPDYQNSAAVTAWLRAEHAKWGPIVESSGFRPND